MKINYPEIDNLFLRKPDSNITEAMAIKILKLGNHGDELKLNKFSEEEVNIAFQKQLQNKGRYNSKTKQLFFPQT